MAAEAGWLLPTATALGRHALVVYCLGLLLLPAAAGWSARRRLRDGRCPSGPLGLQLRLVAATVGIATFATLATLLLAGDGLRTADQAFANAVRANLPAAALPVFATVTHLADTATLTGLCITMALLLAAARQPVLAWGWVLAVAGNGLLNRGLKALVGRARPLDQVAAWAETGFSFPSGHSSGAVVAYGMLAFTVSRLLPARWHAVALAAAVALAWSIGASRAFLGVHFASDVLAGFASGGLWLLLCVSVLARRQRQPAGPAVLRPDGTSQPDSGPPAS